MLMRRLSAGQDEDSGKSREILDNSDKWLAMILKLWQSEFCVGERPMKHTTHNSMRRLQGPEMGLVSRRAWFNDLP